jgi:hypothetical protein
VRFFQHVEVLHEVSYYPSSWVVICPARHGLVFVFSQHQLAAAQQRGKRARGVGSPSHSPRNASFVYVYGLVWAWDISLARACSCNDTLMTLVLDWNCRLGPSAGYPPFHRLQLSIINRSISGEKDQIDEAVTRTGMASCRRCIIDELNAFN